jgi:hypothetical protein
MNDFFLRLMLAALISLCGWFATSFWEKQVNKRAMRVVNSEPIARLVTTHNEVMRRPAKHLIWKSVNKKEELFDGEAIRTANNSEAQIEFIEQKVTVSLDPDSVVEIARENGKLNLSFLEGNLIIKAGENSDLTLRSGDRQIAVGDATGKAVNGSSELTVSKTNKTANLEIQSIKGAVKEYNHDKTESKPIELAKFRILRPIADEVIYTPVSPEDGPSRVTIEFTPLAATVEVTAETGEARDELTPVVDAKAAGNLGKILVPLKIGRNFVRLTATPTNREEKRPLNKVLTPVTRALVRAKLPPELLLPTDKAVLQPTVLQPTSAKNEVTLQWANPGKLNHLRVEISNAPNMKPTIEARELGTELQHKFLIGAETRILYWRVIGRLPTTGEALISPIFSFKVLSDKQVLFASPRLQLPLDQTSIDLATMRDTGLRLAWKAVTDANEYEISLTESRPLDSASNGTREMTVSKFKSPSNSGHVQKLKPGRYSWFVIAKDELGHNSPPSDTRVFSVEGVPTLNWTDSRTEEKVIYKGLRPTLRANWERGPGRAVAWRVRAAPERMPATAEKESWIKVSEPRFEKPLDGAGIVQLEAEALDALGEVLARTVIRTMAFEQAAPPPPPKFTDETPEELKASDRGDVKIAWLPVTDAKRYQVQIRSRDGIFTKSWQSRGTTHAFEHLPPGTYDVVLQSMDVLDRAGEEESRQLVVPQYSDVRAPKFKKLNVK